MKTLVDLDKKLLKQAQKITGEKTKKGALHVALKELLRSHKRKLLANLIGTYRHEMTLRELLELRTRS